MRISVGVVTKEDSSQGKWFTGISRGHFIIFTVVYIPWATELDAYHVTWQGKGRGKDVFLKPCLGLFALRSGRGEVSVMSCRQEGYKPSPQLFTVFATRLQLVDPFHVKFY